MRKNPSKKIIVHVGMHKTATTTIQNAYSNFDDGRNRYVDLFESNHSTPIRSLFCNNPAKFGFHVRQQHSKNEILDYRNSVREQLHQELSIDREVLLTSGEDLCHLSKEEVHNFYQFLKTYSNNISAFAYVRDPLSFGSSAYQFMLRLGSTSLTPVKPNYRSRFESFIEVFGASNTELRPFDRTLFKRGSVIADFADYVGFLPHELGVIDSKRRNASFSNVAAYILHRLNTQKPLNISIQNPHLDTNQLFSSLKKIPGQPFQFSSEILLQSVDPNDLAWLKNVSGIDFNLDRSSGSLKSSLTAQDVFGLEDSDILEPLRLLLDSCKIIFLQSDDSMRLIVRLCLHHIKIPA